MTAAHSFSLSPDWQIATLPISAHDYIRYGLRQQQGGQAEKALVLLNGRTEFIEKYNYLIDDLHLPDSCNVLTWDHRGQGASSGPRSYIDDYETYAQDARLVLAKALAPATPYFVIAHSMGALITLYATLKGYMKPQKIILSSPFLGMPNHPLPNWLALPFASLCTSLGLGTTKIDNKPRPLADFASNPLTHCSEKFARMMQSPFPGSSVTYGWVKASFRALKVVFDPYYLRNIEIPIHIFCAEHEVVVAKKAIFEWFDLAACYGKSSVSCEVIPKAKHELFSEVAPVYETTVNKLRDILQVWLAS